MSNKKITAIKAPPSPPVQVPTIQKSKGGFINGKKFMVGAAFAALSFFASSKGIAREMQYGLQDIKMRAFIPPPPNPANKRKMMAQDVKTILQSQLPGAIGNKLVCYLADTYYSTVDKADMERFLDADRTRAMTYVKEKRDCIAQFEKILLWKDGKPYTKEIEDVRPGEFALSYNFETQHYEPKEVLDVWPANPKDAYRVQLLDGKGFVCSGGHKLPIWDDKEYKWRKKRVKEIAEILRTNFNGFILAKKTLLYHQEETKYNSTGIIGKVEKIPLDGIKFYDITIADNHNFILANTGIITFNCDDYSFRLMGQVSNPGWSDIAFFIVWGGTHAYNCFIDNTPQAYIIEPQLDKILTSKEITQLYIPSRLVIG